MEKGYDNICWLKVTDYMREWLRRTLGTGRTVRGQPVLSIRHLPGVREVMMMETTEELPAGNKPGNAMSATWRNALEAGMSYDVAAVEKEYGVTRDVLDEYMPVACPDNSVSEDGIIRKWNDDTCFGKQQATALTRALREAFWRSVDDYSTEYAKTRQDESYAQIEMVESFCGDYGIDDMYVDALRREWQRRKKREKRKDGLDDR